MCHQATNYCPEIHVRTLRMHIYAINLFLYRICMWCIVHDAAGHCIYNHATKTWAGGVVFSPGRNGNGASSTNIPYHTWDTNVSAIVLFTNFIDGDLSYGAHTMLGIQYNLIV